MTESWEDIVGSLEKPKGSLIPPPPKVYHHESEEETSKRRGKCLEAIFAVFPDSIIDDKAVVHSEKRGKKFDFYPASNTYFIHSTQKYGHDIEKLCADFFRWLVNQEKVENA